MPDHHVPARRRASAAALAALLLLAGALTATGAPVSADAGPDLALSRPGGPVGSRVELFSADLFGMGADVCPGLGPPDEPFAPDDAFEVRWELGVLAGQGSPLPGDGSSGYRYALASDEVTEVLATGSVATEPGVPWRATITIPEGPQPGVALVVNATCWRTGPEVPGGSEAYFTYFYLAVFVVTGPDGVVPPVTTAPRSPSSTGVPSPAGSAPRAPVARPVPGEPILTG